MFGGRDWILFIGNLGLVVWLRWSILVSVVGFVRGGVVCCCVCLVFVGLWWFCWVLFFVRFRNWWSRWLVVVSCRRDLVGVCWFSGWWFCCYVLVIVVVCLVWVVVVCWLLVWICVVWDLLVVVWWMCFILMSYFFFVWGL